MLSQDRLDGQVRLVSRGSLVSSATAAILVLLVALVPLVRLDSPVYQEALATRVSQASEDWTVGRVPRAPLDRPVQLVVPDLSDVLETPALLVPYLRFRCTP